MHVIGKLFVATIFSLCVVSASCQTMKQPTAEEIQGVWSLKNMNVGVGEKQRTREDADFRLYIMEKHYSAIRDFTPKPAPGEESSGGDRSFMADAGTYEFDGKDFVVHHQLSALPVLGSMTFTCYMEGGDTLVLEPQYDKMVLPGMEHIKPAEDGTMGYGDMATKYVFERLE